MVLKVSHIIGLVYSIIEKAQAVQLLQFWKDNPEIAAFSTSRGCEYDQEMGRLVVCRLSDIDFMSQNSMRAFLVRAGFSDEDVKALESDAKLADVAWVSMDGMGRFLDIDSLIAGRTETARYRRPTGDIDVLLVSAEDELNRYLPEAWPLREEWEVGTKGI